MGENLFDARHADVQLKSQLHGPFEATGPPNGVINGEEEPYTIKCICGFLDDDGHTVLCEQCNTWQHIECYYWPELVVPEVHQCTDCFPRVLASSEAAQRQRRHREPLNPTDDRRIKRPNTKTHKKARTKEHNTAPGVQNGWPAQEHTTVEFRNGSPRDQPPPAKRPKTNHRTSTSVSLQALPRPTGHRELNGTHEPISFRPRVPLADCPPDYLSPEFIRLHREDDDFIIAQANTHLNIGVANLLAKWLDDVDAFAEATQGRTIGQVLKFFPQPIEDLETPIQQHTHEDTSVTFHGHHPVWKYLTVDRDIGAGNMIGEVRGTIGRLEDYKADLSNDWERLRHPDHFVFFHPALPIFIDCRREGTLLRYARRSCRPNMNMETIITGEREYRFCFTALTDIPRGAEITIGWDLRSHPRLRECLESQYSNHKKTSTDDKAYIHESVETILAHFGDCACEDRPESCLMGHFDNRLANIVPEILSHNVKQNRKRKSLKRSPPENLLDDHSRAGSEHMVQEDDMDDNRSTSRSTRSKPSREPTPTSATIRDATSKVPEISERDRKKLLQEEMLFNKLEQEKQQGSRKKKRNSGSNINTPSVPNTKHAGRRNSLTSTATTPAPSARHRGVDQQASYFNQGHTPSDTSPQPQSPRQSVHGPKVNANTNPPMPKPTYASGGTQTGPTDTPSELKMPLQFRRNTMSLSRRVLSRSLLASTNNRVEQIPAGTNTQNAQSKSDPLGLETSPTTSDTLQTPDPSTMDNLVEDVEMEDADIPVQMSHATTPPSDQLSEPRIPSPKTTQQPLQPSHPPINPPAPPWQMPMTSINMVPTPRTNIRSANLHVDLPPPPPRLQSTSSLDAQSASGSTPGVPLGYANQTPMNPGPLTNSAVAGLMSAPSLTQPSPMKKKMSLSDYTAKLKAKTPALEKSQSMVELESSSPVTARHQFSMDLVDTPEGLPESSGVTALPLSEVDATQLDAH